MARTITIPKKRAYLRRNDRQHVIAIGRFSGETTAGWAKATDERSTFIFKPHGKRGAPQKLARRAYDLRQVA